MTGSSPRTERSGTNMTAASKESDFASTLRNRMRGNVVILGVGNASRSDDAAGPCLVEMLRERLKTLVEPRPSVHLINGREVPENYIGQIVRRKPDTLVVLDCASLGLVPGEVRIVELNEPSGNNPSTHGIPPSLLISRLKEETVADVFMIAIQPSTTAFGEGLSAPVGRTLAKLASLMESIIRGK